MKPQAPDRRPHVHTTRCFSRPAWFWTILALLAMLNKKSSPGDWVASLLLIAFLINAFWAIAQYALFLYDDWEDQREDRPKPPNMWGGL